MKKRDKNENLKKFSSSYQPKKNGRPRGSLNRKTLFERWNIKSNITNPLTNKVDGLTQDDIVILSLLNKARQGDVNAIKEWLDNRFGKLTESIELETIDKTRELSKEELKKELDKMGINVNKLFDK